MNPLAWLAPSAKRIDFWGIYSRVYDALRELASYREMLDEVAVSYTHLDVYKRQRQEA